MIQTSESVVIMTHAELSAMIQATAKQAAEEAIKRFSRPADSELWSAHQCASYLAISPYTWAHEWSHKPGAPKALAFGTGPKAKRRWKADDVREWAERQ